MFHRFTERARTVIGRARASALERGHEAVEPAHIALVLLDDEKSHAATTLAGLGLGLEPLREALRVTMPEAGEPILEERPLPFHADAKRLLEATLEAAASLNGQYVGTEHILLALLEQEDVPAAAALGGRGVEAAAVRAEIEKRSERRPTGWRPGFDLGKVCAAAMRLVTDAGLDRVGRAAMVAALIEEIDPATKRALGSLGVDEAAFLEALRREIREDASS